VNLSGASDEDPTVGISQRGERYLGLGLGHRRRGLRTGGIHRLSSGGFQ
jgi:hypothetical protein